MFLLPTRQRYPRGGRTVNLSLDGDPRARMGSFSRLDQSPTPYTRPYPSSNRKRGEKEKRERERKGKNRSRLGLLRDDDAFESLARFDGRSKFGLRRSSVSSILRGSEIVLSYRMVKGKTTDVIFVVQSQEERKVSRGCVTFNSST